MAISFLDFNQNGGIPGELLLDAFTLVGSIAFGVLFIYSMNINESSASDHLMGHRDCMESLSVKFDVINTKI